MVGALGVGEGKENGEEEVEGCGFHCWERMRKAAEEEKECKEWF